MAVAAVENELRARGSAGMYMPPMPDQQPQYQQPAPIPQHPQFTPQQQTVMPPLDFNGFMQRLTAQMQKRDQTGALLIDQHYLANVSQRLSQQLGRPITNITDVASDANAIQAAVFMLTNDGRW